MTMPVRCDPRTGRWYFRTVVHKPDGTKARIFGTPGIPGPYHDLSPSKVGAREAERRAIDETISARSPTMTVQTARGLELAKEYLRKIIVGIDFPDPSRDQGFDLLAAIEWICQKQIIETRDRQRGAHSAP